MPEENNCPKPNCNRPESTHRYSAGKRLSICGNGHSWDAAEVAAQKAKAKEAEYQEVRIEYRAPSVEEVERVRDRIYGYPNVPVRNRNPFE